MSRRWIAVAGVLLVLGGAAPLSAQECHDWDGDGSEAGIQCGVASDCEDLAWYMNPSVAELCNGLDDDCDGNLDSNCDRYCEEPFLYWDDAELALDGYSEVWGGCSAKTEYGFLLAMYAMVGAPGDTSETLLYARPYDRSGVALGPASPVGDPSVPEPKEYRCRIAYTGDRALVVWQDAQGGAQQQDHVLKANIVDRYGMPMGAGVVNISATSPYPQAAPWNTHAVLWDGEAFSVFWFLLSDQYRDSLLMTKVGADGTLSSPTAVIVTEDIDGQHSPINQAEGVWNGGSYILVVNLQPGGSADNYHSLRIDPQGLILGQSAIPGSGLQHHVAKGQTKILVTWANTYFTMNQHRGAFLDMQGVYQADTGILSLGTFPNNGSTLNPYLDWSGEMFGISSGFLEWTGSKYLYKWLFYRVLEDGTILDPGGVDFGSYDGNVGGVHWNGREYVLVARRTSAFEQGLNRIVCSCADLDGDNFDACTMYDCDDSDPMVNPTAQEQCRGLKDDDCDGLADCDDPDCPAGNGPGEIVDLVWNPDGDLAWSAPAGTERYDLARGRISDLKRRGDLLNAECAGLELDVNTWPDDGRNPPRGEVLWYLVRPEGAPCAFGTWGPGEALREINACR